MGHDHHVVTLYSTVGVDAEAAECVYSPAKRRGPTPGRSTNSLPDAAKNSGLRNSAASTTKTSNRTSGGSSNQNNSAAALLSSHNDTMNTATAASAGGSMLNHPFSSINAEWNPSLLAGVSGGGGGMGREMDRLSMGNSSNFGLEPTSMLNPSQQQQSQQQFYQQLYQLPQHGNNNNNSNMQAQLNLLHQQMQQQQQQQLPVLPSQQLSSLQPSQFHEQSQQQFPHDLVAMMSNAPSLAMEPTAQRRKIDPTSAAASLPQQQRLNMASGGVHATTPLPLTIMAHTHLIDRDDPEGCRLRAYYKVSMDELFRLPTTPSDEEFGAASAAGSGGGGGRHLAALSATFFAETAIGALVHNQVGLAMELCNAVVHCLRESIQEKTMDRHVMVEVAKAYFLLGVFRAFRGDMPRYFKYRRVCLTYLSKLDVRA
jgi:hypothetical protein